MSLDEAEIWLNQVVKGGLADKETIKAICVMLDELNRTCVKCGKKIGEREFCEDCIFFLALETTNEKCKVLEEKYKDGKAAYEKGYQDGFKQAEFEFRMNGLI